MKGTLTRSTYPTDYKKREYLREALESKLHIAYQKRTDYAKTLLDPWSKMQVRTPDLSSYPTLTWSQEANFVWTVNTSSINGTNSEILVVALAGTTYNNCLRYYCAGGSVTAGSWGHYSNGLTEVGPNKEATSKLARTVSAGVRVSFAGNDSNCSGTLKAYTIPYARTITSTNTLADWVAQETTENLPDFIQVPLTKGVNVRFSPRSSLDFNMVGTKKAETWNMASDCLFQYLMVIEASGVADNTPLMVNIVCNQEGLSAVSGVAEAQRGPSDPQAAGFGMEIGGGMPQCFPGDDLSVKQNISSPIAYLSTL